MAVSNTGSRNGIITWAVVASVLGLGSLIWAVISYTQANKAQRDMGTMTEKYKQVIDQSGLAGPAVTELTAVRDDQSRGFPNTLPLLEVSRRQTESLTTLIGGAGATSDKGAVAEAQAALEAAKAAAGAENPINTGSLADAIRSMTGVISTLKAGNAQLTQNLDAATAAATAAATEKGAVDAASNDKVAAAAKLAADSQANAEAQAKAHAEQLAAAQAQTAQLTLTSSQGVQTVTGEMNQIRQENAQVKRERDEARAKLQGFRVPTDQIIQQADGVIARNGGVDRVFINLGRGDQIAAGMTFEVFDKLGVPRVRENEPADDKLLKGKASIEVVRTEPGISECRIVRLSAGAAISEGDPIVNVVYDKNVKFNFLVYGRFNLDDAGQPTDRDTDVVRRLISGWGANVTDKIDAKTDFVVLGEEPVVPNYTQDQLAREPEKAFEKEQAETALEQYADLRAKAQQLNIPILNQKRFLYMVGYYEEGKR
jgi:hypothetical protein